MINKNKFASRAFLKIKRTIQTCENLEQLSACYRIMELAHYFVTEKELKELSRIIETTKIKIIEKELLMNFLIHLNEKGLMNNYDFDYEKEVEKYIKTLN